MKEILPGIFHWTALHPLIEIEVSSYYIEDDAVLIDPLVPVEGLGLFEKPPEHILLTNRHHYRHSDRFEERFGCTVWCAENGLHEFTKGEKVRPFNFGDTLPGGIETLEIGAICPDETALVIPKIDGVIALADCIVRMDDGPLGFVPDRYMGDDPEDMKSAIKKALRILLERDFENLLLAHGNPWLGGAGTALKEFIEP